jgi:mRNA interferase HicA
MKLRDLIRHLELQGCRFERLGGRHAIDLNPTNGQTAPVPRNREIPNVFVRTICKQLGIPRP